MLKPQFKQTLIRTSGRALLILALAGLWLGALRMGIDWGEPVSAITEPGIESAKPDLSKFQQQLADHMQATEGHFSQVDSRLTALEKTTAEVSSTLARLDERSGILRDALFAILGALLILIVERLLDRAARREAKRGNS